ncbi:MAG: DUF885 domain-containing protein [Actinomycetaceae bacterium]|nr:DUF885 domain-containing protein [Actinomycetaceae bacterium]
MSVRETSPLDTVADQYVDAMADLSPSFAISLGRPLPAQAIEDFSTEGEQAWLSLITTTIDRVRQTDTVDQVDKVTKAALLQSLQIDLELYEAGEVLGALNNISTPVQSIRDGLTMMPNNTKADWEDIIRVIEAVPNAYAQYQQALVTAVNRDRAPSRVQLQAVLDDLAQQTSSHNPFMRVFDQLKESDYSTQLQSRMRHGVEKATGATREFAAWLADTIAPHASNTDHVGHERYMLHSAQFLGMRIDPDEIYAWAHEELIRIHREQQTIARELYGNDTTVQDAMRALNDDPAYQIHGTQALLSWMQAVSDQAVDELADTHFTVTEHMRALECMISPAGDGGIFYTAPSDDFSRPGRMWWAVPPGENVFHRWQEKTTVYHEGMPGHHMQLSRAVAQKDTLNSWRRNACWFSGHGEGWALYAETLMDELGYLSDPAERLGMLDAQRLRAARILVDIGLHLAKERPHVSFLHEIGISEQAYKQALRTSPYHGLGSPSSGDDEWNRNDVWAFMSTNVAMEPAFLQFETTRYLGWPGQASSYTVGQREWFRTREAFQRAYPEASLRDFHDRALSQGGLPLAVLNQALELS